MNVRQIKASCPFSIPEQNIISCSHVNMSCLPLVPFKDISLKILPSELRCVDLSYMNNFISGIGMRNKNGGMEFYNQHYFNSPVTIGAIGHTFIPRVKGVHSNTCCIFSDFLDLIAFNIIQVSFPVTLPYHSDIYIINNIQNFIPVLLASDEYQHVYCFLKHDEINRMMSLTLEGRNPRCEDRSCFYTKYNSLFGYVKTYRLKTI